MTSIDWDALNEASEQDRRGAETLIRTAGGQERRTVFDGGWLNFADATHTAGSPQAVTAGNPAIFSVDGLGAGTETNYRRGSPSDVWANNVFYPNSIGECYLIRITMNVAKATSNDTNIELDLGIGSNFSTLIVSEVRPLVKGQGVVDKINFVFPIFCLATFGLQGGQFTLLANENITVWDKAIFIQRIFTP